MADLTDVIRDLTSIDGFSLDSSGNIVDWPLGSAQPSQSQIDAHIPVWEEKRSKMLARQKTLLKIAALEDSITDRRWREAGPDDAGGTSEGRAWLKDISDQIATFRSAL
ncbi:hypothetical protein CU669_15050 [Paramagnetospirillum kuznetsovii]|uniref:Uncharacterized protein n=1 Tax=Paramagnetospirillum kuznetsovii TaxID=2053833 RepID=A0A364NVI8_9PROT|nr:hypothetical protein [Paramagnetospirillum kuznetsovii]RAU21072.1 hypothetical protein CU669_15050 [Paramagnetospirillum kuznetsovii]